MKSVRIGASYSGRGTPAWSAASMHLMSQAMFAANVLKYEDMVGAASEPAVRRTVSHMTELFSDAGGDSGVLGWGVLESRLEDWCVPYDLWRREQ